MAAGVFSGDSCAAGLNQFHVLEEANEADVALEGLALPQSPESQRSAGHDRERSEVTGRRRVALDGVVGRGGGELLHHALGHADERARDGFATQADAHRRLRVRRDQQQRGEELAALGGVEHDIAAAQTGGAECEREVARAGLGALRGERIEQRADRASAHRLVAGKVIDAVRVEADKCREKARRRAGVADLERRFAHRNLAAASADGNGQRRRVSLDFETQRAQRSDHQVRVAAEERAAQRDRLRREGGENERAIGDAL